MSKLFSSEPFQPIPNHIPLLFFQLLFVELNSIPFRKMGYSNDTYIGGGGNTLYVKDGRKAEYTGFGCYMFVFDMQYLR